MTDDWISSESIYAELYLKLAKASGLTKRDYAIFLLNRVSPILASVNSKQLLDIEYETRTILSRSPDATGAKKIVSRLMEFDTQEADPPAPLYYCGAYIELADRVTRFIATPTDEAFVFVCEQYEMLVSGAESIVREGDMWPLDEKEITDHFTKGTGDNTAFTKFAASLACSAPASARPGPVLK